MSVAVPAPRRKESVGPDPDLLLPWYDRHARQLPWRLRGKRQEPYRVWLSEIMLQQTTVKAVAPYYARFLERWPTVEALARADREDVLRAWAGLGYYARARNLHACAVVVAAQHGGVFPDTLDGLRALPGIGDYTASAVVAIAFDAPALPVDGNVERVVARLFAVEESLPAAKSRIKALAAAKATNLAAFADDSGFCVDALDGKPGIHSARWAGPEKDFRGAMNRIQTLLIERGAREPMQRRAHFIAALCLAWPDDHVEQFEGRVDGVAVWPPRGERGFGYDPLFQPDGSERTFGEMSAEEKHGLPPKGQGLSHRARGFMQLAAACLQKK